jgi:hypothetical protein
MLEYVCLQQTSIVFYALGLEFLLFINTRGVDVGGRPSFFFFEFSIARYVLGIVWSLTHLLLSVSGEHNRLLSANAILDGIRIVVLMLQLLWHRHWCVGEGWQTLRKRNALQILTPYFLSGIIISTLSSVVSSATLYHNSTEKLYYANIAVQASYLFGCVILVYLNLQSMHRGYVYYTIFLCCAWNTCFVAVATYVFNQVYDMPITFSESFGYLGQVVHWLFCSVMCFLLHAFDSKSYSGPGCADDTPIAIEVKPRLSISATSSPLRRSAPSTPDPKHGVSSSVEFSIVPSASNSVTASPADSLPGSVESETPAGTLVNPAVRASLMSRFEAVAHLTPIATDSHTMFVQDVEDLDQETPPHESIQSTPTHFANSATPFGITNSMGSSAIVTPMTHVHAFQVTPGTDQGWITSSIESDDLANPSLMQLHKLLVSIANWMLIGVLIGFGDAIVANIFSDLPRCTQLDPFSSGWTDALKSLFDFLT